MIGTESFIEKKIDIKLRWIFLTANYYSYHSNQLIPDIFTTNDKNLTVSR